MAHKVQDRKADKVDRVDRVEKALCPVKTRIRTVKDRVDTVDRVFRGYDQKKNYWIRRMDYAE
jgi:hypothetical protein